MTPREPAELAAPIIEAQPPDPQRDALVNWFADLNAGMLSMSSGRFAAGEPERNADAVLSVIRVVALAAPGLVELRAAARLIVVRFHGNPMIAPTSEFAALIERLRAALAKEDPDA